MVRRLQSNAMCSTLTFRHCIKLAIHIMQTLVVSTDNNPCYLSHAQQKTFECDSCRILRFELDQI